MKIDILLCINEIFTFGTGTLIASLAKHNQIHQLYFHIFAPSNQISSIKAKLNERFHDNDNLFFLYYEYSDIPEFIKLKKRMNERMAVQCVRILAVRICKVHSNKLLYLDADFICLADIRELLSIDLGSYHLGVVPNDPSYQTIVKLEDKSLNQYFCSGLLIFNLSKWLSSDLERKCIEFIIHYKPKYPDQDALNYICENKCFMLDQKYHYKWQSGKDAVFLHYIGDKPWEPWNFTFNKTAVNLFRYYAKQFEPNVNKWISFNPRKKVLINYSEHRKGTKWLAYRMLHLKHYKGALFFYVKHLLIKLKQKGVVGFILLKSNTRS